MGDIQFDLSPIGPQIAGTKTRAGVPESDDTNNLNVMVTTEEETLPHLCSLWACGHRSTPDVDKLQMTGPLYATFDLENTAHHTEKEHEVNRTEAVDRCALGNGQKTQQSQMRVRLTFSPALFHESQKREQLMRTSR